MNEREIRERLAADITRIPVRPYDAYRRAPRRRRSPAVSLLAAAGLVGVLVLAAVVGTQLRLHRSEDAAPTASPAASPPASSPTAPPPAPLDPRYGVAMLWISPVTDPARRRMVTEVSGEVIAGIVWATDGTGLLIAVRSAALLPGPGGPPAYTSLRTVDLATGHVSERVRVEAQDLSPLVWERAADVVTGVTALGQKGPGGYLVNQGGRTEVIELEGARERDVGIRGPAASSDGRFVFAVWSRSGASASLLRHWPLDRPDRMRELPLEGGAQFVQWRPRSHEIVVTVGGRLELLSLDGTRRSIGPAAATPQRFRFDGSAIYSRPQAGQSSGAVGEIQVTRLADGATGPLPFTVPTAPTVTIVSVSLE